MIIIDSITKNQRNTQEKNNSSGKGLRRFLKINTCLTSFVPDSDSMIPPTFKKNFSLNSHMKKSQQLSENMECQAFYVKRRNVEAVSRKISRTLKKK